MIATSLVSALAGFFLPWLWGTLLCYRGFPSNTPGAWPWRLGNGYVLGLLSTSLLLQGFDLVGQPFHFGFSCLLFAVLILIVYFWPEKPKSTAMDSSPDISLKPLPHYYFTGKIIAVCLIVLLSCHGLAILGEILYRPMFPWDAWAQWATKAKVWFSLGKMVPFVDYNSWIILPANPAPLNPAVPTYTDAAPHYGATVPLWQVWTALSIGHWHEALVNLPWFGLWLSLVLTAYGYARQWPLPMVAALTVAYGVGSLPFVNIHAMLAGYADLPQAVVYTQASLAILFWLRLRSRAYALLALGFGLACAFIKQPGIIWALTLLAPLILGWRRSIGWKILLGLAILGCVFLAILTQTEITILTYALRAEWHPISKPLLDNLLFYGNWNLLFWLLPLAVLFGWRRLLYTPQTAQEPDWPIFLALLSSGALFLILGFGFTNIATWVEDYSTVNRAVLHWAPLCAFFTFTLLAESWLKLSTHHDQANISKSLS